MTKRAPLIVIVAFIVAYVAGFVFFWPAAALIADESLYARAAESFAHGSATIEVHDPLTNRIYRVRPSYFAPGTSLLQAPFVRVGGFRGAPVVSLLCYILTGFLLVRWLVREGRSPVFSLLFLAFLPVLVLARTAMSDVPAALFVCAAQMLIFARYRPGDDTSRPTGRDVAAGLLAALAILVRETNAILVLPFIVGSIVRREGRTRALLSGLFLGAGLTLLAFAVVFGTPFYVRPHGATWSLTALIARLPINAAVLSFVAPLGLWAAVAYRGPRRPEVLVTTLLTLAFFSAYDYTGAPSGGLKELVLSARYFIPLVPILTIALAEAGPRHIPWLSSLQSPTRYQMIPFLITLAAAFAVHPVLARIGRDERAIEDALRANTTARGVLVVSRVELDKYIVGWNVDRRILDYRALVPAALPGLVARDGVTFVALLDRDESDYHRTLARDQEVWRQNAANLCELEATYDEVHGGKRLRIFRVMVCHKASSSRPH